MSRQRELKIVLTGDPSNARRAFGVLGHDAEMFGHRMDAAGRRAGHSMTTMATVTERAGHRARVAMVSAATGGAAALGFGLLGVVKAGADYEQQMARVRGVTSATGRQMSELNKLALKLGAQTKFSAKDAAEGMYELASAGFSVHQITRALPGVMSLAAAGNIGIGQAAETAGNALRGFGLHAQDSAHVADVLAKAVNTSSVEMTDLQYSLKYIGPVAKTTGQSFEDMVAAVDMMGNAGIKGEQAGTSLRAALVRLTKPTKMVEAGFATLHLKTQELYGPKGLRPLPEIIAAIERHTQGMSRATRNQALAQIFGTEALSGMVAVVDAGSKSLSKNSGELVRSEGQAKKTATVMNSTVAGAFENLKGSVETAGIGLFQHFQKPLRGALLDGAGLVNTAGKDITGFFDHLLADPKFKSGDLGQKLSAAFDELNREHVPQKVGHALSTGLEAAAPVIAHTAVTAGEEAAKAFATAWLNSDLLTRAVLGAWLLRKIAASPTFKTIGASEGAQAAAGYRTAFAAGTSSPIAARGRVPAMAGAGGPRASRTAGLSAEERRVLAIQQAGIGYGAFPDYRPGGPVSQLGPRAGRAATLFGRGRAMLGGAAAGAAGFLGGPAGLATAGAVIFAPTIIQSARDDLKTKGGFGLPQNPTIARDANVLSHIPGVSNVFKTGTGGPFNVFGSAPKDIDQFSRKLDDVVPKLQKAGDAKGLSMLAEQARKLAGDSSLKKYSGTLDNVADRLSKMAQATGPVQAQFRHMEGVAGHSLSAISAQTAHSVNVIEDKMGPGTKAAKDALATNFRLAAAAVGRSMDAGKISVKTGVNVMADYLSKELSALGVTGVSKKFLRDYASGKDPLTGKAIGSGNEGSAGRAAMGWIGRPGERGQDDIDITVARGEAILNGPQQEWVDPALRATYGFGLHELFQRERATHSSAARRPRYAKGGVAGMIAKANAIDSRHYPYRWGGGHDANFSGPYDCSGAVSAVLHAGGVLDAPRTSGAFTSYGAAGAGLVTLFANSKHVYMRIGGRYFGTSGANPHGGAGWFPGAPRAGFTVRHAPGAKPPRIPRAHMAGGLGILTPLGQGELDAGRGGMQLTLDRAYRSLFSGQVGGGDAQEGAAKKKSKAKHARGGFAGGKFVATSYGPPWGRDPKTGVDQGGGTTATGVDLHNAPHRYGIAVDPNVIPLGSHVKVWPNPFGYHGDFTAFDTGSEVKGNHIDFYDWRGRRSQLGWGSRPVTVTPAGAASATGGPSGAGGATKGQLRAQVRANLDRIDALHARADHLTGKKNAGARVAIRGQIRDLRAQNRKLYAKIGDLPSAADQKRHDEAAAMTAIRPITHELHASIAGGAGADAAAGHLDEMDRTTPQDERRLALAAGPNPGARAQKIVDIAKRNNAKAKITALSAERQGVLSQANAFRSAIAKLKRKLAHAPKGQKATIKAQIKKYQGALKALRAQAKGLGFDIGDAMLDVSELDQELGGLDAQAVQDDADKADQTQSDDAGVLQGDLGHIDAQLAAGVITTGQAHDARVGAYTKALTGGYGALRPDDLLGARAGVLSADAQQVTDDLGTVDDMLYAGEITPAEALKRRHAIRQRATSGGYGDLTEHDLRQIKGDDRADQAVDVTGLTDAIKALTDEVKRQNNYAEHVSTVTGHEAVRALADLMNGQIVGVGLNGRRQTAGAGRQVRA